MSGGMLPLIPISDCPSMERLEIVVGDLPPDGWHDDDIKSDI